MASTYASVQFHFVFGCKDRSAILTPTIRAELFPYLAGVAKNIGCVLLAGNGVIDHVHLLVGAPPRLSASEVVGKLKANSSRWISEKWRSTKFAWQDGYAVFSVGFREIPQVRHYISIQEEHHGAESYQDEVVRMLKEHAVTYDPRYLPGWDAQPE
jgi:REP element-mobilizing transposase RayT